MVREHSLAPSSSSSRWKIISSSSWLEGSCGRSLWGRWRSWAWRSVAFRASSAARPAGLAAFQSRDWRAGVLQMKTKFLQASRCPRLLSGLFNYEKSFCGRDHRWTPGDIKSQ